MTLTPHTPTSKLDQEFGRMLEESLNEIYIFDAETLRFIQVNRGARLNLGYSLAELQEMTPVDIKPEFDIAEYERLIEPLRAGQIDSLNFNTLHRRKDGSQYYVYVHLQLATFHGEPAFISAVLDVTERFQNAEELRLRDWAIESLRVGVVIADAQQDDCPIISCNHAFEEITGYPKKEAIGRNCRFLQREDREQDALEVIRASLSAGKPCQVLLRNYRKDGSLFWNELTISPVQSHLGQVTHFVGLINDVTDRVEAEEQKREREAQLRAILNTAVEAIITIDEYGNCISVNYAAERMFGYTAAEMIGQNISMLMPSPYREEHGQYIANYLNTGEKKIIGIGREIVAQRKDGEEFPVRLSVSEVQLEDRRLFTGIIQDITEQKEAQRRLVQSERLAALGEAMARLAHESRNSLQRIQIAVETARLYCVDESPMCGQLDAIERASDGLDALLDELKNYAAPLTLEKVSSSLTSIWRDAWRITAGDRQGRETKLIEDLPDSEPSCPLDRFRMGQVFRNLFENALAACEDPVEVQIGVTETHTAQGKFWRISVRDNGPGLCEQHAARVFEPFFTTKAKGTGLGMAIASRIVEAHGGTIKLAARDAADSDAQGAEFLIVIPQ